MKFNWNKTKKKKKLIINKKIRYIIGDIKFCKKEKILAVLQLLMKIISFLLCKKYTIL